MRYIVADLEWNGAYSKKASGYFNEIIEIGAVALDETMETVDTFHRVICPSVSKKLSRLVQELTHITEEELKTDGDSFSDVMADFSDWAGEDSALLTWSNTDLLVLMENYRFFYAEETIPFLHYYADIQPYCQRRMGVDMSQQMGLSRACEHLGINAQECALHRALDDAALTAKVFAALYEPRSFSECIRRADDEFYKRLLYKVTIISDPNSPLIKRSDLAFSCPECGRSLHRKSKWQFRNRHLCAEFLCRTCQQAYIGRVQYKKTYDGLDIRRSLKEKRPPESNRDAQPLSEQETAAVQA